MRRSIVRSPAGPVLLALVPILPASTTLAGEALAPLRPGAYAVEAKLSLPHLDGADATSRATLCLRDGTDGGNPGFRVLSANTPLAGCPVTELRREGEELAFEIRCEGRNAAAASARYRLAAERFEGRIALRMGGKNMTLTEVQSGHRIGECEPR